MFIPLFYGYLLVAGLGLPVEFLATIVLFAIIMNVFSYLFTPYMINIMYGAKRDPELQRIVDEVARRSGFNRSPKAVVVEGPPNAFAYGNFLTGRYVAVTTGMLQLVDREELEAVIGHELGHHKHRDMAVLLFMGIIPSILYYLGLTMIRLGLLGSVSSSRERRGESSLIFVAIGIAAIIITVILQILIFAFSRLREYYADAHGAKVAGVKNMQRSLAKLHIYYSSVDEHREFISNSKLKTLFIYALMEAVGNPYISYYRRPWRIRGNIDHVIESLKKQKVNPITEILSTHPPIPKRLAFLDTIARGEESLG